MATSTIYGRSVSVENFQAAAVPVRGFEDLIGLDKYITGMDGPAMVMEDVPVFRSGTFRDSYGEQFTVIPQDIDAMVENFSHLSSVGYLPAVPFRNGHKFEVFLANPSTNGCVIGHFVSLRAEDRVCPIDGQTYRYLLSKLLVTDAQAQIDIKSKTMRNVSAEIGSYETNNDLTYGPVFLGAAGVDLPAVEGLLFSNQAGGVMSQPFQPAQPGQPGPVNGSSFAGLVQQRTAPAVQGLAGQFNAAPQVQQVSQVPQPQFSQSALPQQQVQLPQAQPQAAVQQAFTCAGQQVADPAQVQSYIQYLEGRTAAYSSAYRRGQVVNLALQNAIPASDVDDTASWVETLTDEQFTSWFAMTSRRSGQPTFGQFAAGQQQLANPAAGIIPQVPQQFGQPQVPGQFVQQVPQFSQQQFGQPQMQQVPQVPQVQGQFSAGPQQVFAQQGADEINLARQVVENLILAGKPPADIKAGPSYAKLVAAGCAPALS